MFLDKSLRGTGISKKLVLELISRAQKRGFKFVMAEGVSKGGRHLMDKLGFQKVKSCGDFCDMEIGGKFPFKEAGVKPG